MFCCKGEKPETSRCKISNEKIFTNFELGLIRKHYEANCTKQEKKRRAREEYLLRKRKRKIRSLDTGNVRVISHLTNFKSRRNELRQIQSIRISHTPEPYESNDNINYLLDTKKKDKCAREIPEYTHIITIYDGDATVKHAYAVKLNCEVVIKSVPRPHMETEKGRMRCEMLLKEIDSISNIQHKNILMIYEYVLTEYEVHIIMEYDKNGTLSDLIYNLKFLPEKITRGMFKGLAHGLRFCHERSICHRNITCDNIYVSEHMNLKLANFRLMKKCSGNIKEPLGTYIYTAPEVRSRKYCCSFLADMWSMGVVLYVMLIGMYPYGVRRYKTLADNISAYKLSPPSGKMITYIAQSVIDSLLCHSRKRITSKELIKDTWFDYTIWTKRRFASELKKIKMEEEEQTDLDEEGMEEFEVEEESIIEDRRRTLTCESILSCLENYLSRFSKET